MSIDASSVGSIITARSIDSRNLSHISGGHRCLVGAAYIVLWAEVVIPEQRGWQFRHNIISVRNAIVATLVLVRDICCQCLVSKSRLTVVVLFGQIWRTVTYKMRITYQLNPMAGVPQSSRCEGCQRSAVTMSGQDQGIIGMIRQS